MRVWHTSDRTGPITSNALQNFPAPCTVYVEGYSGSATAGDITITFQIEPVADKFHQAVSLEGVRLEK